MLNSLGQSELEERKAAVALAKAKEHLAALKAGSSEILPRWVLDDISKSPKAAVEYTWLTGQEWDPREGSEGYWLGQAYPSTEPLIATDPTASLSYAKFLLLNVPRARPRRRFVAGEKAILAAGPKAAMEYVRIIKGPWPEAETILSQDKDVWKEYKAYIEDPNLPVPTHDSTPYEEESHTLRNILILGGVAIIIYSLIPKKDPEPAYEYAEEAEY